MSDLNETEKEAFQEWLDNDSYNKPDLDEFREHYHGNFDNERAFAQYWADDVCGYYAAMEKAGISTYYFDDDAFARDLFCDGFWMSKSGNVFSD